MDTVLKEKVQAIISNIPHVVEIITNIKKANGTALLVGGAVRDLIINQHTKDLDIEVYGLTIEQLQNILSSFGTVRFVGKSFGVLRLHTINVDWSLPRKDASGRKPMVTIDPHMNYKDAFARRDLTINAMGIDLHSYTLIDPFNGKKDIANKILKTPHETFFVQDPLRFFRVMQFISRFEMLPDTHLNSICASMDISNISQERIALEFQKLLLKSKRPSLGIRWLHTIGRLHEILPELYRCIGIKQNNKWHPEGDVFEHSMQTLDAAAIIAKKYTSDKKKLLLLYASLSHDLGKAITTKKINDEYKSFNHEKVGAVTAKQMLKRIINDTTILKGVEKLVVYHMQPGQFIQNNASLAAYKRLAKKLAPETTLSDLADLALADKRGRNGKNSIPLSGSFKEIDQFIMHAKKAHVLLTIEKPLLKGSDIMDIVDPGPQMGQLLKYAYKVQLEKGIQDKKQLKQLLLKQYKN